MGGLARIREVLRDKGSDHKTLGFSPKWNETWSATSHSISGKVRIETFYLSLLSLASSAINKRIVMGVQASKHVSTRLLQACESAEENGDERLDPNHSVCTAPSLFEYISSHSSSSRISAKFGISFHPTSKGRSKALSIVLLKRLDD